MSSKAQKCLILDNGAYWAKIGHANASQAKVIPNCIMKAKSERRRAFIGGQIEECRDASGLYYILNFQRGFLVNWDTQKTVWDYMFGNECCPTSFSETPLIITEPIYNFPSIQEAMTEIFFEEYEVEHLLKTTTADLAAQNYLSGGTALACVVVDIGYSFTHIVPIVKGKKVRSAMIRIDVGGKLLTNHLKETTSYRQLNVMDETYVINQVKEDACFVSQNFTEDMSTAKKKFPENKIAREYVLPDFTSLRRGFLREPVKGLEEDYQVLRVNNERFVIPEILFNPSDIGISQMGIVEATVHAVNMCPKEQRPHLFANILLIGGSAQFFGLRQRFAADIRTQVPEEFEVNVQLPKE